MSCQGNVQKFLASHSGASEQEQEPSSGFMANTTSEDNHSVYEESSYENIGDRTRRQLQEMGVDLEGLAESDSDRY